VQVLRGAHFLCSKAAATKSGRPFLSVHLNTFLVQEVSNTDILTTCVIYLTQVHLKVIHTDALLEVFVAGFGGYCFILMAIGKILD